MREETKQKRMAGGLHGACAKRTKHPGEICEPYLEQDFAFFQGMTTMTHDTGSPRSYVNLQVGDPAPWFHQRSTTNADYAFDTAAGRYIVLCFFGSAADPHGSAAVRAVEAARERFDDARISFFGVSNDPTDEAQGRLKERIPGIRYFWDFNLAVSRQFGSAPREAELGQRVSLRLFWMVLDPTLRIVGVFPLNQDAALMRFLDALPPPHRFAGFEMAAPVFLLPNVFEPDLCGRLVSLYETAGGEESGFMRDVGGKTVQVRDASHKVRKDHVIDDKALIELLQRRVMRRVVPEIRKVHQFETTRMERYIVCCYDAAEGGHFRAHRDNTTAGTAHRRFAVSINLNADFEGGEVSFPEYGPRSFKAPPGGAVVFSCSLLHAVSRVTAGRRYAFLPFLYDEAAAKLRQENLGKVQMPA